ncbi:Lactonase, 7-bladed beta-propeller-domain-containing protein [Aspergillus karnatakaensis]|uniref:Lactonase, 7-bladed beta-propeller-domain-containing protein n=1 Tax=Aspergillus karnatakaensis TaxID=1810916 RepID=UPI003CCDA1B9
MHLLPFIPLLFGGHATASHLYAASYAGTVTSLGLSKYSNSSYQLSTLSQTTDCGPSPSWLMLDGENNILYCLDEGIDHPNGTLTSFKTFSNGTLSKLNQHATIPGPVASAFYTAAYSGQKFFALKLRPNNLHHHPNHRPLHPPPPTHLLHARPRPDPSRQDAPHPHGVVVDPTGQFLLVPDLGADLIRIFHIHPVTGHLTAQESLVIPAGSGPRHAVFWTPKINSASSAEGPKTKLYLVSELDNMLRGYDVLYAEDKTLHFTLFYEGRTFGGRIAPEGAKAAEIAVSVYATPAPHQCHCKIISSSSANCVSLVQPANTHLLISNRNDTTFGVGNDSIAVFNIAGPGNVEFSGLYPAYGSFPRHFEFSPGADMVAIALKNEKVVVAEWDEHKGVIGEVIAESRIEGEVTAVIWGN